MYLPVPVLVAIGIAFLVLLLIALRRRAGPRDLIAPPRPGAQAPPQGPPPAWPTGAPAIADLPPGLEGEMRALLSADRKIEAIRRLRAATGLNLLDAKNMVERL